MKKKIKEKKKPVLEFHHFRICDITNMIEFEFLQLLFISAVKIIGSSRTDSLRSYELFGSLHL